MPTPNDPPVEPIRVLAAWISDALLQTLADTVRHHPDLRLIGRAIDPLMLLLMAAEGVDLVVTEAVRGVQPGLVGHVLGEYPEAKVMVFHPEGGVTIYWRGLRRRRLAATVTQRLYAQLRLAHGIESTQ
jgi:hypothetical protein